MLVANSVPDNFLGLPDKWSAYESARFVVLRIPYDATTSYGVGTRCVAAEDRSE